MFELHVICPQASVERIDEALQALEALSISSADADAGQPGENALFGEPDMPAPEQSWGQTAITALFSSEQAATDAARLLALQDFFAGSRITGLNAVVEQDWVRLTQSQFEPVPITDGFWIVPSWHEPPTAAKRIIHLDPGMAFGTGTHPTTRMCLGWIATHPCTHQRVLDYGCGSGILAIGAALHGATDIDAVDIDPAAVQATRDNAKANGVLLQAGLPDTASGVYDTVLANILATPLKVLAPLLCQHLAAGGALVLAGILERQTAELQIAYQPWLRLEVADRQDGWVLLAGHAQAQ